MRLARIALLAVALTLGARAFAFNEVFTVAPATPVAGQDFTLTFTGMTGCIPVTITSAQASGNRIDVRAHQGSEACFSPPGVYSVSQGMRVNAAGDYDLTFQTDAEAVKTLGKVTVAPTASSMRIFPSSPRAGQEFVVQFEGSGCGPMTVLGSEVAANAITVTYREAPACFATQPPGALFVSAVVRAPTAGTYVVSARREGAGASPLGSVAVQAGGTVTRTGTSLNGLWFDPGAPGRGLNIIEGESGQLFIVWFTYGSPSGGTFEAARWYVMSSGTWTSPTEFSAPIYAAEGPGMRAPFLPASVRLKPVGIATVAVSGPNAITFTVQGFDGLAGFGALENLTRFRF